MIFVTGGSGILGSALLRILSARGERVRAAVNKTPLSFKHALIEECRVNLFDPASITEALAGCDRVYHCAGLVSFHPADRAKLFRVNVEATANLVDACVTARIKKFVHVSSVAALGRMRDGETISENSVWSVETNNSVYGESKYLGELEVWRAMAEGLNGVVVNPVVILGPGQWDASSMKLFQSASKGFRFYTEGITGFVDVDDVAEAMILLMNSDVTGERFIISAEDRTYRDMFSEAAIGFGKMPPSILITPFLADLGWRAAGIVSFFTGKPGLITKETAASSIAKVRFDNSKFLKFFPDFKYTPVNEAIVKTCRALQQNLNR